MSDRKLFQHVKYYILLECVILHIWWYNWCMTIILIFITSIRPQLILCLQLMFIVILCFLFRSLCPFCYIFISWAMSILINCFEIQCLVLGLFSTCYCLKLLLYPQLIRRFLFQPLRRAGHWGPLRHAKYREVFTQLGTFSLKLRSNHTNVENKRKHLPLKFILSSSRISD